MSDAAIAVARPAGRTRIRVSVALLVGGFLVASLPGLAAGNRFLADELPERWVHVNWTSSSSARELPPDWTWQRATTQPDAAGRYGKLRVDDNGRFFTVHASRPPWRSMPDLVLHEAGWTAAAVTLAIAPLLFVWWRRTGVSFGPSVGIACLLAAGAAVGALVFYSRACHSDSEGGVWWTVPLGAALMGAAFVFAPAPERRGDE